MEEEEAIIIAALSTLTPIQLSNLTQSIFTKTHHHNHRLSFLISSPVLFSLTLHHLHSLSLHNKTLLIAKYLLSSLHHLTRHFHHSPFPPHPSTNICDRDLDAALLLFLLCDVHQSDPNILEASHNEWREVLSKYCSNTMLMQSSIAVHYGGVLLPYIETVIRCWRFVGVMGGSGMEGRKVAAARAAVVALPTVEVKGGDVKCVICRDDMREGRDVCELPCEHMFHWMCILPWLEKRNTCPCCRFQLPTEDVLDEIERLWGILIKIGGGVLNGDKTQFFVCSN